MNLIKHSAKYLDDKRQSAEELIVKTVKKYVDFLAPTYGPAGKKILIVTDDFSLKSVDDGHMASKDFEMEDELPQAIIRYIREATEKTDERVGDGTTTSALIMSSLIDETMRDHDDPFKAKNLHKEVLEIKKGAQEAVEHIKSKATKVNTQEELYSIAYNSYNNEKIAKLVSETLYKIGADGSLTIEDSNGMDVSVDQVNGLEIYRGFASPYFITNREKNEAHLSKPLVLVFSERIEFFKELFPVIKSVIDSGRKEIAIVADSFSQEILNQCIFFKYRGDFSPLLIEAPGYGDNKLETLKDIAAVLGCQVIDPKSGTKLSDVRVDHLGRCESITSTKDKTIFVGGQGNSEERINMLKLFIEASQSEYDKDALKKRIAALSGGVAVIKVGAPTENEQKAIKAKVEDAVNATRVAFKDGIVPGAGKTFLEIKTSSETLNKALKVPRKQLEDNGAEFLDENVSDPAGVLIAALESAVSIACGLIETGGIIAKKREDDKDK